jgi:hypothetical protein
VWNALVTNLRDRQQPEDSQLFALQLPAPIKKKLLASHHRKLRDVAHEEIRASDWGEDDRAGKVAVSGSLIVVGASGDDGGETTNSGSVSLFSSSSPFTELAKITASDAVESDLFGSAVAASCARSVVGAPHDSGFSSSPTAGKVYLYSTSSPYAELAQLTPPITYKSWAPTEVNPDVQFGSAVAVNDALIVVGARASHDFKGRVYLFSTSSPYSLLAELQSSNLEVSMFRMFTGFGHSVAVSNSLIAVGEPSVGGPSISYYDHGSVYLFSTSDTYLELATLTAGDMVVNTYDSFGSAVAMSDSLIVVGAPYDPREGVSQPLTDGWEMQANRHEWGSVYLFSSSSPYSQLAKITASSVGRSEYFGVSLAVSSSLVYVASMGSFRHSGGSELGPGSVTVFSASAPYMQLDVLTSSGTTNLGAGSIAVADSGAKILASESSEILGSTWDSRSIAGIPGADTYVGRDDAIVALDLPIYSASPSSAPTSLPSSAPSAAPTMHQLPKSSVTLQTKHPGTVEDFDDTTFKENVAAIAANGVTADDVEIVKTAGSVIVTTTVLANDEASARSITTNLNVATSSPAAATSAFGVNTDEILVSPTTVIVVKVTFTVEGPDGSTMTTLSSSVDNLKTLVADAAGVDISAGDVNVMLTPHDPSSLHAMRRQLHTDSNAVDVSAAATVPSSTTSAAVASSLRQNLGTAQQATDALQSLGFSPLTITAAPVVFDVWARGLDDPHMRTGHGDAFDFMGEHDTIYNLISHSNMTVNALFQHADYISPGSRYKVVHGSFMRTAFVTVLTNVSRTIHAEYAAVRPLTAEVTINGSHLSTVSSELKIDNIILTLKDRTLTLQTPEWHVAMTSKVTPSIVNATSCATGWCILNVEARPLFDTDDAKVAPHGLIAQSYDGDDKAVIGKLDRYNLREVTTSAMGEGAIEGVAAQYAMADKFDTHFAFSRYGKISAPPRNVSALSGKIVDRHRLS